jgi:hypothetical protein
MQQLRTTFLTLLFLSLLACSQEDETPILVATEDVLFVGSDKIRISGRLLANREVLAGDHGFIFSTTASFTNAITLSLGEKVQPGRFIGEKNEFDLGQTYFVKAYADVEGQRIEGEVIELSTLNPFVTSFTPSYGIAGQELTIEGKNLPEGTKVFFGNQEAQVLQNLFESKLIVKIPAATGQVLATLKIKAQDTEITFPNPFEYQAGKYTKVSEFPGNIRIYNNIFFSNATGFHVGFGKIKLGDNYPKIQRFNPSTGTWTEVSFPGNPRQFAFATANYLGGGAIETSRDVFQFDRSFWKINGSNFERLGDLPFNTRDAVAVEWNSKLFLFGGLDAASILVRMYDPQQAKWISLQNAPLLLGRTGAVFTWKNRIFVLSNIGQLWEYEPNQDRWLLRTTYPGKIGFGHPLAEVIGNKAYLGLFKATQELWELDLETLKWKTKNQIIGLPQSITSGHFQYNGSIYFLRAPEENVIGTLNMELYKFDPDVI